MPKKNQPAPRKARSRSERAYDEAMNAALFPTIEEVGKELGIPAKRIRELKRMAAAAKEEIKAAESKSTAR